MKNLKSKYPSLMLVLCLTFSVLAGCSGFKVQDVTATDTGQTVLSEIIPTKQADDFYAAVNEAVLKEHDVEKTGGWNWFYDLEEKSFQEQKEILQNASIAPLNLTSEEKSPSEYRLGVMYTLALDQILCR